MGKATTTAAARPKREKLFHPQSRKAGQLIRKHLRISKLSNSASKRGKNYNSRVDLYGFFYHSMPPGVEVLTLEDIHNIVRDVWLTRHDEEIEAEKTSRRKGRPKSVKQVNLEEAKLRESELYRTGMEVPDLTHAANVEIFRQWDVIELAYIDLLRFIRISKTDPQMAVVSRPGKHFSLTAAEEESEAPQDLAMDVDVVAMQQKSFLPTFADPSQFRSTMMTMDGPLE